MEHIVNEIISLVVLAIISLLLSWVMIFVKTFILKLRSEINKIQNEEKQRFYLQALNSLDDLTTKAVLAMEQTTAKELRGKIKIGLADKDLLYELSGQVLCNIKNQLKPDIIDCLDSNIDNLNNYIENSIESKILQVKSLYNA